MLKFIGAAVHVACIKVGPTNEIVLPQTVAPNDRCRCGLSCCG